MPERVIGVLVPTLDLLTQTIEAWRRAGHNGPAVAVCSLGADPLLEALGVRCTTNPTQLSLWASSGPMLVFATYASLAGQGLADDEDDAPDATAPGALEQALRGSYGQTICWFTDPSRALCLKLAGTPTAERPLVGMCDSARCPQATHHPCHRPVWAEHAERTETFIGQLGTTRKTERNRLQADHDRPSASSLKSTLPAPA